tara:strand:- start:1389 stop:4049 length:2661 start_codon:yes stop_codon:yes gene_type:complete
MSKFKSFAKQGSFRDKQIQLPDKTAKIKEETARTVRGMNTAQAFLEENQSIYLQAQKMVQGLEQANRDQNFQMETENRQAFRDQVNQDFQMQLEAEKAQAAADQKNLQSLTAFSQSAFKLYNQVDQNITEKQTKANAAKAYAAGADFKTVVAIQALTNNLTKAEFGQQDFIRKKIEEGGNLDAYYSLYQTRHTRGFINNIAVAQNTAYLFHGAAQQFIADFEKQNPNATLDQKKQAFQVFRNEFAGSFVSADDPTKALNADLLATQVFPIMQRAETQILNAFDSAYKKEQVETVFQDTIRTLNVDFENGGVPAIMKWLTTNPSTDKFKTLATWVTNRSKDTNSNVDWDETIDDILDFEYVGVNGNVTTLRTSRERAGTGEVTALAEARNEYRRAKVGEYKLQETEQNLTVETQLVAKINEFVADGDGHLSEQERAELELIYQKATPGYNSPAWNEAQTMTLPAREAAQQRVILTTAANQGSITVAQVKAVGNYKLQQEFLPIAREQEKLKGGDDFKSYIEQLKTKVTSHPLIQHAPLAGVKNDTVVRRMHKAEQEFRKLVFENNVPPSEAFGQVYGKIDVEQKTEGGIDNNGNYTSMLAEIKSDVARGEEEVQFRLDFTTAAQTKGFRTDPYKAVNAYGQDKFYEDYYAMQRGEISERIKFAAGRMFMSPVEAMNYFASGLDQPPIPLNVQAESIRQNLKPITRRLYNASYSTNDMRGRGNMVNAGLVADAPTRFGGPAKPLSSYAPQVASIVMETDDGQPGMDIFFEDKKFPAVLPGVVKEIGWQGDDQAGYGNYVVIESTDPSTGQKVDVLYSHLEMPTHLPEGSSVMPGMIIGKQGGTGSVRSADGTVASIDFLKPAPKGSTSMVPYRYFKELRERIATQLSQ